MSLTPEERKQLVEEVTASAVKILKEELLVEFYALERNAFIDKAYALLAPMMIHWCLIRYARLSAQTEYIDHWKSELITFMTDMANLTMKGGNQYHKRIKAYKSAWSCADYDTNPSSVLFRCRKKFKDENIDFNSPITLQATTGFVEETPTIIELLAKRDFEEMQSYIESL